MQENGHTHDPTALPRGKSRRYPFYQENKIKQVRKYVHIVNTHIAFLRLLLRTAQNLLIFNYMGNRKAYT